jgi:MFS family permease
MHIAMFIVARTINGIGAGMLISNTPVYMSEISPPHTRGLLVGSQGVAITTAYVVSSAAALGFHYVDAAYQWRLQFVVMTALGFALFASLYLIPESPRWLTVSASRFQEFSAITNIAEGNATI